MEKISFTLLHKTTCSVNLTMVHHFITSWQLFSNIYLSILKDIKGYIILAFENVANDMPLYKYLLESIFGMNCRTFPHSCSIYLSMYLETKLLNTLQFLLKLDWMQLVLLRLVAATTLNFILSKDT